LTKRVLDLLARPESPHLSLREKVRYSVFLNDVWILACTSFGGPQVHLTLFLERLVDKRKYLTSSELIELNALCSILPGPTSTQTLTATAFKIGGPKLAFLTLILWITPAVAFMTFAALALVHLQDSQISLGFTRFLQPIAVGFVTHAAFRLASFTIKSNAGVALMLCTTVVSFNYHSPWVTPFLIISGGALTAIRYKNLQKTQESTHFDFHWNNILLFFGILIGAAVLGHFTSLRSIRLFENFYRNGSMIFGGGQALIPLMYNEFVAFKHYLSKEEFLSGYALVQALPGPVFSFCSYLGVFAMRSFGIGGQLLGSMVSSAGIFLPGTLLIFFVYRFWDQLKRYRVVKASLEGINAVSCGLVAAAALILIKPMEITKTNLAFMAGTFLSLYFTKIPGYAIVLAGLLAGLVVDLNPGLVQSLKSTFQIIILLP
jgi:chromate transporter